MLVPFKNLPENARTWIYPSDRLFTAQEEAEIGEKLDVFLQDWTAHGAHLEAGYEIRYSRFIVIGLNQQANAASGCSIDASVHFIQQLEREYNLTLLDRMNVSFRQNGEIVHHPLAEFKKLARQKTVTSATVVFNNLVVNKEEYETLWEVPAAESWHKRFFKA